MFTPLRGTPRMTNRLRTRLNSDALDDRIVPDASPVISVMPPAGTPEYLGYMLGMQSIPANLSGSNSQPTNAEPDSAPGDGPALAPALATSGGGTTLTGDPRYYTDPNGVSV